jgi:putative aldouronate transport system permease protein
MYSIRETGVDKAFKIINYSLLVIVLIIIIYPLWFVLIASISDPDLVNSGKVYLIPKRISFEGYRRIFQDSEILMSYKNTVIYTTTGTLLNLILTLMCAYALSKKKLYGRNVITFIFTFTMFFSGGLIPTYLVVKQLGLLNKIWALILPGAISMYNVIIARTFFQSTIPEEIEESAMIDGSSVTNTFIKIILPLSKAIISVLALFYAVGHWNSYFDALIYLTNRKLYPLQIILREILIENQMKADMVAEGLMEESVINKVRYASLIKYGVIIVSSVPVFMIYPFIQKYFVGGIMIGSLKG